MRLPIKPWALPAQHADLADALGELHGGGENGIRRSCAPHDFQQLHHLGGREEMQAQHMIRARCGGRDRVNVEIRCVAGEDRAGFGDLVQAGENIFLHRHILEHRLDDEIAVGEILQLERARERPKRAIASSGESLPVWPGFVTLP